MSLSMALQIAERAIIGAAALEPAVSASLDLSPSDFNHPGAVRLWSAMQRLSDRPWRGAAELAAQASDDDIGRQRIAEYLDDALTCACHPSDLPHYTEMVRQASVTRSALLLGAEAQRLEQQGIVGDELVASLMARLGELSGRVDRAHSRSMTELADHAADLISRPQDAEASYVPMGLDGIDEICGGWQAGVVSVVGAATSHGKSALMLHTAIANAEAGRAVHLLSAEDLESDTSWRVVSRYSGIDAAKLRRYAHLDDAERASVEASRPQFKRLAKLRITPASGLTAQQIVAQVALHARTDGTQLVLYDYLQRLPTGSSKRYEVLSEAMNTFDGAAKRHGLPWVCGSQLNRGHLQRDDPHPALGDFRDSGVIDEVAKLIIGLHRDGKDTARDDRIWVGVLKQSNGRLGDGQFEWDGPRLRIGGRAAYRFEPSEPRP